MVQLGVTQAVGAGSGEAQNHLHVFQSSCPALRSYHSLTERFQVQGGMGVVKSLHPPKDAREHP